MAEIAGRQHGVIRLDQLLWAGLSYTQVKQRTTSGRLHRLYRGVYAVGHRAVSQEGRWIAATFAFGDRAVLSHESAACLWGLHSSTSAIVHVTLPNDGSRRRRPGIRLHYSRNLNDSDITLRHNIPVTTAERTRRDLGWGKEPTKSILERRFLKLVLDVGLTAPAVNEQVGPYQVDFLWRPQRLVVEADSWKHHSDRQSFESDRRRDRYLQACGFVVLRFTYREVTSEPSSVADTLRAHLTAP